MKVVVAVHLGSVFVSGAGEVVDWKLNDVIEGLHEDIRSAEGLVVIDGSFSDAISSDMAREIAAKLDESHGRQHPAERLWGCDSGEMAYPGWQGRGLGAELVHADQAQAARAAAPFLKNATKVVVTGAWATRDGGSGCVSDVLQVLRAGLPEAVEVRLSENCLFEEYIDCFSAFDEDEPEDDGSVVGL